jgi:hypothetical protein
MNKKNAKETTFKEARTSKGVNLTKSSEEGHMLSATSDLSDRDTREEWAELRCILAPNKT